VVVEPVGSPNRLTGLAVRPTGKSIGEYRRVGLLTDDTRPVLDSKIRYQETSQQGQDDADSLLHGSIGDGEYVISLV